MYFFIFASCEPLKFHNLNTFTGVVRKVQKIQGGRKRGWRKKACGWGLGLEPGMYCVLGEVPSCTPRELFRQVRLSMAIDRVGRLRNTMCSVFWR